MTIVDDLKSLLLYNRWADARVVDAIREIGPDNYHREPAPGWSSIGSTVLHLTGATQIWACRLAGEVVSSRPAEADYPTLEQVSELLTRTHTALDEQLSARTPDQLLENFHYRNLQGQEVVLPLWAVFRHVVNHATYHRGQIASKIKLLGGQPPATDLVYWAIEQTSRSGPLT
jgi:uncharacterized damage-inducible protein DinB